MGTRKPKRQVRKPKKRNAGFADEMAKDPNMGFSRSSRKKARKK